MFNPVQLVIDHFVEHLRQNYSRMYGSLEPDYPNIIGFFSGDSRSRTSPTRMRFITT